MLKKLWTEVNFILSQEISQPPSILLGPHAQPTTTGQNIHLFPGSWECYPSLIEVQCILAVHV